MDPGALRWALAIIGLLVIAGVYLFATHQSRLRRRHAYKTLSQEELDDDNDAASLPPGLDNLSSALDQPELQDDVSHLRINPALDASLRQARQRQQPLHLPLVMQQVTDEYLIGHILKHEDNQLLTGAELNEAFAHLGLELSEQGLVQPSEQPCFSLANLTESGDFRGLQDDQFTTTGFVCFFDMSRQPRPRACYEVMLKKVDELVRLLDLKVYNAELQLLTLEHVTSTRERLRAYSDD